MLKRLLSLIALVVIGASPAFAQKSPQVAALNDVAVSALKGTWKGSAGPMTIELTVTGISPDGTLAGTMNFPSQAYTLSLGKVADKDKKVAAASFDGASVKIDTPLGSNYDMKLVGATLRGSYTSPKYNGSVMLDKK